MSLLYVLLCMCVCGAGKGLCIQNEDGLMFSVLKLHFVDWRGGVFIW